VITALRKRIPWPRAERPLFRGRASMRAGQPWRRDVHRLLLLSPLRMQRAGFVARRAWRLQL
jgi:hypothetical protein